MEKSPQFQRFYQTQTVGVQMHIIRLRKFLIEFNCNEETGRLIAVTRITIILSNNTQFKMLLKQAIVKYKSLFLFQNAF